MHKSVPNINNTELRLQPPGQQGEIERIMSLPLPGHKSLILYSLEVAVALLTVLWLASTTSSQEESCSGGGRATKVRLSGRTRSSHVGRVEVSWSWREGPQEEESEDLEEWWPVCGGDSWTDHEAGVVCRELTGGGGGGSPGISPL